MSDYSHRRSRAAVRLCDASGKPLANADVSYRLVNHEFLFGCGAFDTLPATDVGHPRGHGNLPARRQTGPAVSTRSAFRNGSACSTTARCRSIGGRFEPVRRPPRHRKPPSARPRFLQSKGQVRVKGHPLCWHTACADWLMA